MADIAELLAVMRRLRDPQGGCPWDISQDFQGIAPYTIEEAFEVADAIERDDMHDLREELGDLLLQVVFHARIAEEAGYFDFGDCVDAIVNKMIRRHPHVFSGAGAGDEDALRASWERIKAQEKAERSARRGGAAAGLLDDVPPGLPALVRALALSRRAAGVGFDWPGVPQVRAKVDEELAELDLAIAAGRDDEAAGELGDVLFALANLARHLGVDPEAALRGTNEKFRRRFADLECALRERGLTPQAVDADTLERHWQAAKHRGL